jgi:hypothetical protein
MVAAARWMRLARSGIVSRSISFAARISPEMKAAVEVMMLQNACYFDGPGI